MSVIVPTYNRAHLVGRAIQSVLNQTYRDLEVIVVSDGSTDHTREAVMSFADPRIRFLESDMARGASATRNAALGICRGEYIAFIDDDEWLPRKLEKQMKAFEIAPPEVGFVYTRFWKVKDRTKIYVLLPKMKKKEGAIDKALLQGNFIALQSAGSN